MMNDEKDLLWEELDLASLVNSMQPTYGLADRVSIEEISKSKIVKKHNDMVQKPTYNAIMGRYQAQPSKPKSIRTSKLDLLADPIRGRYSRIEKILQSDNLQNDSWEGSMSPSKRSNMSIKSPRLPNKSIHIGGGNQSSGFFLTGGDDASAEPDHESSNIDERDAGNIKQYGKSRSRLAATLRKQVGEARVTDKFIQKTRITKRPGPGNRKAPITNKRGAAIQKKEWKDNTAVNYLGKNKGFSKRTGVIGEDYKEKRSLTQRRNGNTAAAGGRTAVASSGYGYSAAGRKPAGGNTSSKATIPQAIPKAQRTRLLRKLTEDNNSTDQQSDQADPVALRKKQPFLRSKSTIDIPDHSRDPHRRSNRMGDRGSDVSGSDLEGPGARRGGRISNNNRYQPKVQSAPAQMARGRGTGTGGAAAGRRGPTDSTGRLITLDGLSKVPARKQQLSPLKALAPQPRGRRRPAGDPSDSESSPIGKLSGARKPTLRSAVPISSNAMISRSTYNSTKSAVSEPVEAPAELSSDASHLAHIALQRAYKQQHDPVWHAQQEQELQQQMQMQALQVQMQQQLQSLNTSFQNNFPSSGGAAILLSQHDPAVPYTGYTATAAAGMPALEPHQQASWQQQQHLLQMQQPSVVASTQPLSTGCPYPDHSAVSTTTMPTSNYNCDHNNSTSTQQQQLQVVAEAVRTEKISSSANSFPLQQQQVSAYKPSSARDQYIPQPSPRSTAPTAVTVSSAAPAEPTTALPRAPFSTSTPADSHLVSTAPASTQSATATSAGAQRSERYQLGDLDSPPTQSEDEQEGEDNPYDVQADYRQAVQNRKGSRDHTSPHDHPKQIPFSSGPGAEKELPAPSGPDAEKGLTSGSEKGLASPRSSTGSPIPSPVPPVKELDAEERLVEEMVSMDLDTALQRLQKYQTSSYASVKAGTDIQGDAVGYAKPGATATLAKHARNLSGHLSAAEQHLAQYRSLADGYIL